MAWWEQRSEGRGCSGVLGVYRGEGAVVWWEYIGERVQWCGGNI